MADQDRERWTKLVADFEASDLTQREFASERGDLVQQPAKLDLPPAQGVEAARRGGADVIGSRPGAGSHPGAEVPSLVGPAPAALQWKLRCRNRNRTPSGDSGTNGFLQDPHHPEAAWLVRACLSARTRFSGINALRWFARRFVPPRGSVPDPSGGEQAGEPLAGRTLVNRLGALAGEK
jgi:hypothetical protein